MSNDSEFTPPPTSLPPGAQPNGTSSDASPVPSAKPAEHGEGNSAPEGSCDGAEGLSGEPDPAPSSPGELSSSSASASQSTPLPQAPEKPEDNFPSGAEETWVRATLDLPPLVVPPGSHLEGPSDPLGKPLASPPASLEPPWQEFSKPPAPRPRHIPNLGHTLLLLILAAVTLFATEIVVFSTAMALHLFGHEGSQQLLREPRLLIPCMAISYLIIVALAWPLFSGLWREPFPRGIRWNAAVVRRRSYIFLGVGVGLSVGVQLLSNFLPIPKTLPIDNFFRTPADLWLVATFGTLLAPACEELAFRGFLLPSLASAWDWMASGRRQDGAGGLGRDLSLWARTMQPHRRAQAGDESSASASSQEPLRDPKWSANAIVFSSILTSIGFALLHADQLAHSLAPLAVLFGVSLVLCAVRLKSHSLAASALVHAAYNGTIFLLIFYATDGFRHLDKLAR